jgi:hypothetical protein
MTDFVDPFPMRCTVLEQGGTIQISIPPRRNWTIVFFLVWLTGWTYGGIEIGRKLLSHFDLFNFIWMFGWAFGVLWVSYALLYALAGREIVQASAETLTRRTQIFGLGPTKAYLVREIRDLRYQPEVGAGRSRRASRIAFDYGAKTVSFATEVEEAEAAELISRIMQRCNIARTASPQESGIKFWQQQ